MSGDVLASFGPMGSLSASLERQAAKWDGGLWAVIGGVGNESLDTALDTLVGAVNSVAGGLGSGFRVAGSGVQKVGEHFGVADT